MMRTTSTGVMLSTNMGEIMVTLSGDAVYNGNVVDMLEGLDIWESTLGGTFDEWQSALTALDARR